MFFTADAEDVAIMNKAYRFKPPQPPADQLFRTDKQLLVGTVKAFSNLNFTWREQLIIRLCFCCNFKDRQSKMFEKGKKQLYSEMDLVKLIKQLRVAALMSQVYLKPYQTLLVDWLAEYRLDSAEEDSSG
jgi:hypothetical protein